MLKIFSKQQSESMRELGIRPQIDSLVNKYVHALRRLRGYTSVLTRFCTLFLISQHATTAEELHHLSVLATRRRFQPGELESDTDNGARSTVDLGPLSGRIDGLAATTSTDISGLKAMIQAQTAEMAELRRLLSERKEVVTIVHEGSINSLALPDSNNIDDL
jgi:hypothetical protein